jgi:hypothetical protein
MRNDEALLQAYLDNYPHDALCRQALADLFEEHGDLEAARGQRWLADHGKWPDNHLARYGQAGWHWWSEARDPRQQHAVLPDWVQQHMPVCEWLYPTRIEAEAVLAHALTALHATASLEAA